MNQIRIATRKSLLAVTQANIVKTLLEKQGKTCELVLVSTKGDQNQERPLHQIGGNGLFVRKIEEALLENRADIAVHSGKDLPAKLMEGLVIAGVPQAGAGEDCILWRKGSPFRENGKIGTGSPRRILECKKLFPEAEFADIRGNIDTRLGKLAAGEYDAIVLAKVGLDRLQPDLSAFDRRVFTTEEVLPAACQGILAVECRADQPEMREVLAEITDEVSWRRFCLEHGFMEHLMADCSEATAAHSTISGNEVSLQAMYRESKVHLQGTWDNWEELCRQAADWCRQ
jgi:hydroxymethylbilane synthase